MKYYTIEIITTNGQTAQAIYERADYKTALSAFYSIMASALANPDCEEALAMVINNNGTTYNYDHYKAEEDK